MEKIKHHYSAKYAAAKTTVYAILVLVALVILLPFLFAVSTSFSGEYEIYGEDYNWLFHAPTFENYAKLFATYNIVGSFINSILYILPPVFGGVFCSALAAYALSRIRFPGRKIVFYALISTMVIPGVITLIPSYILFYSVYHWTNTPLPIIIPGIFGAPMTMFFIKQFYEGFPRELEEAAFIDGMTRWGVFFKVAFPLAKPILITQIILSLNGAYNDYLTPLLYVGTIDKYKTLQLVLSTISTARSKPYTLMMAGSIVALVPTFVMFLCAQRYFVDGIVFTGIKA